MFKHTLLALCIGAGALGLSACGDNDDNPVVETKSTQNIVGAAQSDAELSILVEAVEAANLGNTLKSGDKPAPFTVFAPTNDAFAKLLKKTGLTKAQLLGNTDLLTNVLTHHVVAGAAVKKSDITIDAPIQTLEGDAIKVNKELNVVDGMGEQAGIIATDIMATNGVIHKIDTVLMPSDKTVVDVAQANENFSILVEAVVAADLADALATNKGLTVFAPTNDAFAALLTELGIDKAALLANKALLTDVLKYHVVATGDPLYSSEVTAGNVKSLQGGTFSISTEGGVSITDARNRKANVVATDVQASNGVIHVIDKVILPAAQ